MPTANLEYLNAPVPAWLSVLFVVCTFFTAWLLARAIQRAGSSTKYYWLLVGGWLTTIVALALLSAPTPLQQLAFEQPNAGILRFPFGWLPRAGGTVRRVHVLILRFPFGWLPAFIVPVVLFSHLASLYQLLAQPASASQPKS